MTDDDITPVARCLFCGASHTRFESCGATGQPGSRALQIEAQDDDHRLAALLELLKQGAELSDEERREAVTVMLKVANAREEMLDTLRKDSKCPDDVQLVDWIKTLAAQHKAATDYATERRMHLLVDKHTGDLTEHKAGELAALTEIVRRLVPHVLEYEYDMTVLQALREINES